MRSLGANEIVASIVRWSNDHVVYGQTFKRIFENRVWEVWAVAVEGDDAPLMTCCEVRKHRSQTRGKTLTFLRNHPLSAACEVGKLVNIRFWAHDGNF